MTQTFEDLWNGNISPAQDCIRKTPELRNLINILDRQRCDLEGELCNHQLSLLDNYIISTNKYCNLLSQQAFSEGFRLATKLLSESLIP